MKVALEHYNPDWKRQFEEEKQLLTTQLADLEIRIEHIGSTAVEGLCAKPTIDIMIGVHQFELVDGMIYRIEALGYEYIEKYNEVMPQRRFFQKNKDGLRTHHLHVVEAGSDFWVRHLKFRDHLRTSEQDRNRYSELKQELATRDWNDRNEYAAAKSDFIRAMRMNRQH